ncbi:hypothetical protein XaFJ1_GM003066 [Xanthomonas albilineans]|nr:hypothetical protein XaFJ1_GM003066 [Xanthomonas albilineans]
MQWRDKTRFATAVVSGIGIEGVGLSDGLVVTAI